MEVLCLEKLFNASELISHLKIKDFDFYIIIAVGSKSFLHKDIEAIYNENKEIYYDTFKNSIYYNNEYLMSFSALTYRGIQQFCGIYLYEKNSNKNNTALKLIKKGYKFIYNFIITKPIVSLYDLRENHLKYVARNSFSSTVSSYSVFSIAIYLCNIYNLKIKCDSFDLNLLSKSLAQIYIKYIEESNIDDPKIIMFFEKYITIGIKKKSFKLPLNEFTSAISKVNQTILTNNSIAKYSQGEINKLSFNTSFSKGTSKIGNVLLNKGINIIDLLNITSISHDTLNTLLLLSASFINHYNLPEDDFEEILGTYIMLNALIEDYRSIKRNYLINSYEENLLDLQNTKKIYQDKINLIEENERITSINSTNLQNKNKDLAKLSSTLEKQIQKDNEVIEKLKSKNNDLEEYIKYLQSNINDYRNIMNNMDTIDLSIESISEFINLKKCIIVGGNINWQNSLKFHLPDCKFLSTDDLNRNFNFIKSSDIVVFNDSVNSHAMFKKIKSKIEKSGAKFIYCNPTTNIKLSLQNLYIKLNESEK